MGIGNNGGDGRCGRGGSDAGQQTVADKGEVRIYCCSYFCHTILLQNKSCVIKKKEITTMSFRLKQTNNLNSDYNMGILVC